MTNERKRPHCWAAGPETVVQDEGGGEPWWTRLRTVGSTCLLPDGHPGPHHFTPDDALTVTFAPAAPTQTTEEDRCQC